jgi:hypothetical protein
MQALAVGFELAFFGRLAPPGGEIAVACFPVHPPLAALPGTALLIVVLRIGRTPLPLHPALHATDRVGVGLQLLTEQLQTGFSLTRDNGDCGGTQIQADDVAACSMLGFVIGVTLQGELD